MLQILIPEGEQFNEQTQEFLNTKETKLQLEHSLISLSKWESKWCKSFLSTKNKTDEEALDYIRCMTITPNIDPITYNLITQENIDEVNKYIDAPMTATIVNDPVGTPSRESITSELIYYWMLSLSIPFECERWHLNRLLMLIRVCNAKNNPGKKMSQKEIMKRNAALNAERRARTNSKG